MLKFNEIKKPSTQHIGRNGILVKEKERIAKEQAAVERRRRGRKSTILTSPLGVQEDEDSKLETLLGK